MPATRARDRLRRARSDEIDQSGGVIDLRAAKRNEGVADAYRGTIPSRQPGGGGRSTQSS